MPIYPEEEGINFDRILSLKAVPEDILTFLSVGGSAVNEPMVIRYCQRTEKAMGELNLENLKILLLGEMEGLKDEHIRSLWKEILLINSFESKQRDVADFVRALLKVQKLAGD